MNNICKPGDAGYIVPGSVEFCEVIGCSEIATILGYGYEQPKDLWLKKTHRKPATEFRRIFDRGHDMEPIMARHMRNDYGRLVVSEQVQYRDPARPWLIYHADGMFPKWSPLNEDATPREGAGPWEAKAPGSRVAADMKRDGMSQHYLCQVQGGIHVASVALGQKLMWATCGFLDYDDTYSTVAFDVARSDEFIAVMLEKLEAFHDCLVRDVPPEPINPRTIPAAPVISGELKIITDGKLPQLAAQWVRVKEVLDEADASDKALREQMKALLEDATKAEVPGVATFSYTFGKPTEAIDGAGLLTYCEWLALKCGIEFDRSNFVTPKAPTRTFRPKPAKE